MPMVREIGGPAPTAAPFDGKWAILDAAPDATLVVDEQGRVVLANLQVERVFGGSRSEIIGAPLDRLLPLRYRQRHGRHLASFFANPRVRPMGAGLELLALRSGRDEFPVEISLSPIRVAGTPMVIATIRDVTERKRLEEALRSSEARFRGTLDTMLEGCQIIGHDWRYRYVNEAAAKQGRSPAAALLGHLMMEVHPGIETTPAFAILKRCMDDRTPAEVENEFIYPDGTRAWFQLAIQPVPEGIFVLSLEITRRKHIEEQIRKLNVELEHRVQERTRELQRVNTELQSRTIALEAANKELDGFSYSVSHDLRAPLRAIDGFSRLLEEACGSKVDAEGLRFLAMIRTQCHKMAQLIDDLLTFARMGRKPIAASEINMEALAREVFEEVCGQAGMKSVGLQVGPLPPAWGDPSLIRQVWTNLLSNAIKYSATREQPQITVSGQARTAETEYCVRDNGVGFDMQYYNKLFAVFERLHSAEEFPGSGVGLAIVHRIVSRHGGRVWAEAKENEGAAFYFTLPRGSSEDASTPVN